MYEDDTRTDREIAEDVRNAARDLNDEISKAIIGGLDVSVMVKGRDDCPESESFVIPFVSRPL